MYFLYKKDGPTGALKRYPNRLYGALQTLLAEPTFTPATAKATREQILSRAPKLIVLYDDAVAAEFARREQKS